MARVTVEDCVQRIPNRFDLCMLAAQRARNVGAGASLSVDRDNDKNPVVALREIAEGTIGLKELENSLIQSLQKVVEMEEPLDEEMDLLALQRELDGEQGEADADDEIAEDVLHIEDEDATEIPAGSDMYAAAEDVAGEDVVGEDVVGEDVVGEDVVGEDVVGEDALDEDSPGDGVAEDERS